MKTAELRKSILQAAVQGKLVSQNIHDEPASELLKRIQQEKALLIKKGKIKKEKSLPSITDDEIPYQLPDGWVWCRLGDITTVVRGASPRPKGDPQYWDENNRTPYHWIKISDISKYTRYDVLYDTDEFLTKAGKDLSVYVNSDFIITAASGSIGKSAILGINGYIYDGLIAIRVYGDTINKRYLISFICDATSHLVEETTGTSWKNIRTETLKNILFPLPPLVEQQRVVAKVDELMALCDELEAEEKKLDSLEVHLAEYLPKSILQAAVRGKLVPQNTHDEPASELLKRIQQEKTRLIKKGKLKKEKPLPPITEDEIPYELPDGWAWCRATDICIYIQRGKSPNYSDIKKYPVLSQKCIQWSGIDMDKIKFISPESIDLYEPERFLKTGDLLWNSTGQGTLGRIMCYDETLNKYKYAVVDSHVTVVRHHKELSLARYLFYWFAGPLVQEIVEQKASGSTKQIELSTETIRKWLIPLPPLAEQQRIVAKVDELMALCDELKTARNILIKPVAPKIIPFPQNDNEGEKVGMVARGDASRKHSDKLKKAIDDLLGDD